MDIGAHYKPKCLLHRSQIALACNLPFK